VSKVFVTNCHVVHFFSFLLKLKGKKQKKQSTTAQQREKPLAALNQSF